MWRSDYGPDNAPLQQDDPGTLFPAGCTATIPDCFPYGHGAARSFECQPAGGIWVELL